MPIGIVLQVALLALVSTLVVRKLFQVPSRVGPLLPPVFSTLIYWAFLAEAGTDMAAVLGRGAVSGLLACGALYVILGIGGRLEER